MQSARNSLRIPSECVKLENKTLWGVGDDLVLSGTFLVSVVAGTVSVAGIALTPDSNGQKFEVCAPTPPFPVFRSLHSINDIKNDKIPLELRKFHTVIEIEEFGVDLRPLAPSFQSLWHPIQRLDSDSVQKMEIFESWKLSSKRVVALGPKNSGKSSLCRYLANFYLQSTPRVFYLELDPGQPEYTPPGNLTLHQVPAIQFSRPYSHADFRGSLKSLHFGYTSPFETPGRYLEMCRMLFDEFKRLSQPQDVLIVNTAGWTKGLGLELNTEICQIAGPSFEFVHLGESDFEFGVVELQQAPSCGGFSGAELRALQTTSYLHQQNLMPLSNWPPYDVELGSVDGVYAFALLDSAGIDFEEDLQLIVEGTLVSITLVPKPPGSKTSLSPKCLNETASNELWKLGNSVGFAVVQSLGKRLRLLTPLDASTLDLENNLVVLVRGRIQLPLWEHSETWVTEPVGVGSKYTKFRRNIQR